MNAPGHDPGRDGSRTLRWWIVGGAIILATVVAVMIALAATGRDATSRVLGEMAQFNVQEFGGGLTWARYEPLGSTPINRRKSDLPPTFVRDATNALPDLLKRLDLDVTGGNGRPTFRDKLPTVIRRWLPRDENKAKVGRALAVFCALGSNAAPVLPQLSVRLTNYPTSTTAVHALAAMGPISQPAFLNALASSNEWVRTCGAWGMAQLGAASRPHAARVVEAYRANPNSGGAGIFLWCLGEIGGPPEAIVPILSQSLGSPDAYIYKPAAAALERLAEIAAYPEGQRDAWTREENAWFTAQRPALIQKLESISGIPNPQGPGPADAVDKALRTLKNGSTNAP